MANYYMHNGKKLPRRTSIDGQLDKSGPLTYWAANCACDYIINEMEPIRIAPELDSRNPECIIDELYPIIESARKNFRTVSALALDIGSTVHDAIHVWLKTGREPESPSKEVLSGFIAFLEWLDQWESWKTIKTEHTVYCDRWAGTLDWLVELNGVLYVVDFKTSKQPRGNKPYEEWGYQTAGYRSLTDAKGNGILRLDKESGMPDWYDLSDNYESDLAIGNILVDLWWARHPNWK